MKNSFIETLPMPLSLGQSIEQCYIVVRDDPNCKYENLVASADETKFFGLFGSQCGKANSKITRALDRKAAWALLINPSLLVDLKKTILYPFNIHKKWMKIAYIKAKLLVALKRLLSGVISPKISNLRKWVQGVGGILLLNYTDHGQSVSIRNYNKGNVDFQGK